MSIYICLYYITITTGAAELLGAAAPRARALDMYLKRTKKENIHTCISIYVYI